MTTPAEGVIPDNFQQLKDVPSQWQQFIRTNVPAASNSEDLTYVAQVGALESEDSVDAGQVFVAADVQIAEMKYTSSSSRHSVEDSSWYQKTFVFIYDYTLKTFTTYTPMIQTNLLMLEGDLDTSVLFKPLTDSNSQTGTACASFFVDAEIEGPSTAYYWKTTSGKSLAMQSNDGGDMVFQDDGSLIVFSQPFPESAGDVGTPKGFALLTDLHKDIQGLVNTNIPQYAGECYRKFVAHVNFDQGEIHRLYIDLYFLKATLEATQLSDNFSKVSWNQYYFVFVEKEKHTFEVFTPIAKENLGLAINRVKGELFTCNPPKAQGWTQFEFVNTGDECHWLWRLKGKGLYMHWDSVRKDIILTRDATVATRFTLSSELEIARLP